jgi:fibronectin-binding autotransporter adhesin
MNAKRFPRGLYAPESLESRIAPATIIVTSLLDDNGAGTTLREAIVQANALGGTDIITFAAALSGGTIVLNGTEIPISDTIKIVGPGVDKLTVSGNNASRIFNIADGNNNVLHPTAISGLALRDGNSAASGGAIVSTESLSLTNVVVHSSNAGQAGGGVDVRTVGKVVINNVKFTENTAGTSGGGMYASADAGILVTQSIVGGNTSGSHGGGMYLHTANPTATILVDGTRFLDNDAVRGGGLELRHDADAGRMTVRNSTFTGNTATVAAGALYLDNGRLSVVRSVFTGNSSGGDGGAITSSGADGLSISFSRFDRNTAGQEGGALYSRGVQPISITSSTFTGNQSATRGGAIHIQEGGVAVIKSSTLSGNTATTDGGAISLQTAGTSLLLHASTVSGNRAVDGGGVFADTGSKLTVSGGSFIGNVASDAGGGLATTGTGANAVNVLVTGALFQANRGDSAGGMDTSGDGTVRVDTVRVIGNVATGNDGGGMYLRTTSSLLVQNSLFYQNSALDDGGGLLLDTTGATVSRITFTKFLHNVAVQDEGGGFGIFGGTAQVISSVISGNVAGTRGGGVAQDGGTATFTATTRTGNWAPTSPNVFP